MKILGVKIDNLTFGEAVETIAKAIKKPSTKTELVATINPEIILQSQKDAEYKSVLNGSLLSVADGTGVVWAAKKIKKRLKVKIPGIDLIDSLAKESAQNNWRWYLLGSAPGVAKRAANSLLKKYPGIKILKSESGGEVSQDGILGQPGLIERIRKIKPDILIVALGAPKQEFFIRRYRHQLGAKIAVGAGGSLDCIAGEKKRAPKILRRLGLEWLWRLILEPRRVRRIWNAVVVFPMTVRKNLRLP